MERKQRRRTSGEVRFELNAGLSVFNQSRVSLSNMSQQQIPDALGGATQEVAFSYSPDLSHAFEICKASGVPPVHELFGGFIGCYQYKDTFPSTQDGAGALISVTKPSSPPEAHGSLSHEVKPIRKERNGSSNILLHTVLGCVTNENEFGEFDCSEVEAILDQWDEL